MEIGNHSRVFEYDGAYRCLDCQARWGALPGQPKMPAACLPPADVTAAEVRTVLDRKGLEGLLNMRDPFAVRELLMKALDTPPQYVHAPAGWKLVPIEPTEEMLLAIENGGDVDGEGQTWMEIARIDYAHLLKHIPEFISLGD